MAGLQGCLFKYWQQQHIIVPYIIISICDAIFITAHEYIFLFVFVMTSTVVPYGKVPL